MLSFLSLRGFEFHPAPGYVFFHPLLVILSIECECKRMKSGWIKRLLLDSLERVDQRIDCLFLEQNACLHFARFVDSFARASFAESYYRLT